jgi:hypothetical protein
MKTVELSQDQIRESRLNNLRSQFAELEKFEDFSGSIDRPNGHMTQCNLGGILIILSASGDGAVIWSDWSGAAVSEELTEVEIEYFEHEDEDDLQAGFRFNDTVYYLNDFMRF